MTPSVAAVTVQSTGTLSVVPDVSVNARSAPDAPGDVPDGGAAQPDSTPTARSIKAVRPICGNLTPDSLSNT